MNWLCLLILCVNIITTYEIINDENSDNYTFIPPALLFNMVVYYGSINQMQCFYIDYYKFRFIDLYKLGEEYNNPNSTKNVSDSTITLCKEGYDSSIFYNYTNFTIDSPFKISYISSPNDTYLKLTTKGRLNQTNETNITIIYECKKNYTGMYYNSTNNTLTVTLGEPHCLNVFEFRYLIHKYCGIFSYLIIFCGFFCLLYGYSNGTVSYIVYSIFTFFEISLEIFDMLGYNGFNFAEPLFYYMIICGTIIIGGIFGAICSRSFLYRKAILSWFTGKVIYNILFYLIIIPLFSETDCDLLLVRELTLVFSIVIPFVLSVFVKEKGKYTQLITALAMNVVGCYFIIFVGINFIGGKLPFDLSIVYSHKFKNKEKDFYANLTKFRYYVSYFILYLIIFIIGFIVMDPIKDLVNDTSKRRYSTDTDDEDGKELAFSTMKSPDVSKTGGRSCDDDYE